MKPVFAWSYNEAEFLLRKATHSVFVMGLKHKALTLHPCCCLKSACHRGRSCLSWQLPSPSAHCKFNQGVSAPKSISYDSLCWHINTVQVHVWRGTAYSVIPLWARGCRIYRECFYFAQCQGSWENTLEKVTRLFAKTLKRCFYRLSLANIEAATQPEALNCQRFHMYF